MNPLEHAPAGELAARWPDWASGNERRTAARRKLLLYTETHLGMVKARIEDRFANRKLSDDVSLFASRSPNLFKAVVDAIAVAYGKGCQRELRGFGESVTKAFAEILRESGISAKANGLNARAWGLGPTIVSPHIDTRKRLALDVITPDSYDVRLDGPYVEAVLWRVGSTWIELDASEWRYYSDRGELEKTVPHAVGLCPAVPFAAMDQSNDWWCSNEHLGLVDASLDAAYKMALGLYNRQVSGNKLLVIQGNIEDTPPGQTLGHPALPLFLKGSPSETDVKLIDRNMPAADHLGEISAIIALAVSVYGISPSEISGAPNNDWGTLGVSIRSERLGALRDKQVPFLRASELELWPLVCDLIRGSAHKHAKILPPGDEVREALRVSFPDLAPPDDVLKRIEAMQAGLPFGLSSPADWLLASRPELTRSEAEELLQSNLKTYLDTIEPLVNRNIPGQTPEANGAQTLPQQQGRQGGQISGQVRNEGNAS